MPPLVVPILVLAVPPNVRELLPDRLRRVIESRSAATSEFQWTLSRQGGRDDGLVETYRTQTVGDTVLQTNFGDANGFHRVSYNRLPPSGLSELEQRAYETPAEKSAGTRRSLVYDGRVWNILNAERPSSGIVMQEDKAISYVPFNFAAAGLSPAWWASTNANLLGLDKRFLEGFDSAEWTEQRSGRFEIVSAEFNGRLLEWTLDSRQGGAPVRAAFYQGDRLVSASETELAEVDGRWVPTSISFYKGNAETPFQVIDVQKATFDEPWHAKELTPNDMGLLFGTQMVTEDGLDWWTGGELISTDEYIELTHLYGVRPDARIVEMFAEMLGWTPEEYLADIDRRGQHLREEYYKTHGEAPWLSITSKGKDEWDLYVERFIKEHKLEKPRIKRAHEILDRAKKLRDVYLRKHVSDIRKAERRRNEKKLAVFDAHTQKVFEQVLVRGLNRLTPKKPTPKKTASRE